LRNLTGGFRAFGLARPLWLRLIGSAEGGREMDVRIRGRAARFEDLSPGTFFCALRTRKIFGLSMVDAAGPGAFLFSSSQNQGGLPWAAPRGVRDDLVSFPGAIIRAEPNSAVGVSGSPPFGALINLEDKFYMRAANGFDGFVTCNVATGLLEEIPAGVLNMYPSWQAGYLDGERFEPIFEFPLVENQ
jgi:hypothetical protein